MKKKKFDCSTCGACCTEHGGIVQLCDGDRIPASLIDFDLVNGPVMKQRECGGRLRCVALRGRIGRRVKCLIYDERPRVCASFELGGVACQDARSCVKRTVAPHTRQILSGVMRTLNVSW